MESLTNFLGSINGFVLDERVAAYASVLGLVVALVGFSYTTINLYKSKTAVQKLRDDFKYVRTVSDLSSLLSLIDLIKIQHQNKKWDRLPDNYSQLRKSLIEIKSSNTFLADPDKSRIQSFISFLSSLEFEVEEAIDKQDFNELHYPTINLQFTNRADSMRELLIELKEKLGESK